jgi:hypothetical protein
MRSTWTIPRSWETSTRKLTKRLTRTLLPRLSKKWKSQYLWTRMNTAWEDALKSEMKDLFNLECFDIKSFGFTPGEDYQKTTLTIIYDVKQVEEDDHQSKERRCKKQKQVHCELQTLPRKCAFDAHEPTKLVATKTEYNQRKCVCGLARTRTYCKCTPGVHRCPECYADHRIEVAMANGRSELNSVAAL